MAIKELRKDGESLRLSDVDTYVFDYGGVVAFHYREPWQSNISKLLHVDPKAADELLSETSPQGQAYREGKMTRDAFWQEVIRLAGVDGVSVSELEKNWAQSYQIDQRMLDLITRLRTENGAKVGVMMNTDVYRHNYIEQKYKLSTKVDFIVSSYQTGVTKPNPKAYHLALISAERLATPGRVIYIDDKQRNIEPCRIFGMKGYRFTSYEDLKDMLHKEAVLDFDRSNT